MRKREAIQPRKSYRMEADTVLSGAGSNTQPLSKGVQVPSGSIEHGEYEKDYMHTWEVWQAPLNSGKAD
jgi:hypothetical protein